MPSKRRTNSQKHSHTSHIKILIHEQHMTSKFSLWLFSLFFRFSTSFFLSFVYSLSPNPLSFILFTYLLFEIDIGGVFSRIVKMVGSLGVRWDRWSSVDFDLLEASLKFFPFNSRHFFSPPPSLFLCISCTLPLFKNIIYSSARLESLDVLPSLSPLSFKNAGNLMTWLTQNPNGVKR